MGVREQRVRMKMQKRKNRRIVGNYRPQFLFNIPKSNEFTNESLFKSLCAVVVNRGEKRVSDSNKTPVSKLIPIRNERMRLVMRGIKMRLFYGI